MAASIKKLILIYIIFFYSMNVCALDKPDNFIYLKELIPTIQEDIRYYTGNNFIGCQIKGYEKPVCILTKPAAYALLKVQNALSEKNLGIKVYDCYRPQVAVDDFFQWSQNPNAQKMKAEYYPHIDKSELFKHNYIAYRSGHTRGSTVDLTIIDLNTYKSLDMGTPFDFMDPLSHPSCRTITAQQFKNRILLQSLMRAAGFIPLSTEWWHFTLKNEPYKDTYFNFPVE